MFGKIKDRLKNVFSKTDEVIEEEKSIEESSSNSELEAQDETQIENKSPPLPPPIKQPSTQDSNDEEDSIENKIPQKDEKEELIEQIEEDKEKIDALEEQIEEEIEDTEKEVQELDQIQEEKDVQLDSDDELKKEIIEEDKETKDLDHLEEQLEETIQHVEEDIDELKHIEEEVDAKIEEEVLVEEEKQERRGMFSRLLGRKEKQEEKAKKIKEEEKQEDKGILSSAFGGLTQKTISDNDFTSLWAGLEVFLLEINIAFEIVEKIEKKLKDEVIGNKFSRFSLREKIKEVLVQEVESVLHSRQTDFDEIINQYLDEKKPVVIMMLGVNGTGKTTTIGKIINYFQKQDKSVVVAAADTFRAAAVEQVKEHCDKLGIKCVAHNQGADPAAVAYDAIEHAKAKDLDVVLIDTAGRMPNNANLMEELKKIKRVSDANEIIFIGDSISGNDLTDQIKLFNEGLGVTGVVLTKVDTDERPGSVVTTAYTIHTPIYFLGTGQTYDDLHKFDAKHVAEQLFNDE